MSPPNRRLAVLVSGSGTNLQALLGAIAADASFGGRIVVVGSDQPGCLALERARQAGIPTVAEAVADHPDRRAWELALSERLSACEAELIVLAGFMRLLSTGFLAGWPGRVVNIHPSLLPAFPGLHGVRDALAYGVKVTGTTAHLVDAHPDHGPIIAQRAVEVAEDDDEVTLHARIKEVEHQLLPAVVKLLCHDRVRVEGRRSRIVPALRAEALTTVDLEGAGR